MGIYRGPGGTGDGTTDATISAVADLTDRAETAAENAESSETNAASSASSASTSATNAATSATNASNSATAAQTAQTNAETAETNAETAQAAAEAAQAAAETAETNAETAETNAATSATNAANSATAASTSATNAATSASNASTSETNAATSATSASNSATASANSATDAQTAQTAAEAARDLAVAAQEAIDGLYLGAQASDPTLDNNGDPVTAGDWYYNTTTNVTRIYDGAQWVNGAVDTSSFLLSGNNLSDLTSASDARTNLGLGTAATTASTDYATAAQGSLANSAVQPGDNVSDLTNDSGYLTSETNDLTAAVTWANVPDANITQTSVTQHQAALSITESQISDLGSYAVTTNNLSDLASASTARTNLGLGTAATTASTDYATAVQGATADSALQNIVEDTTPQLGGTLDCNSHGINVDQGNVIDIGGLQISTLNTYNSAVLDTNGSAGTSGSIYIAPKSGSSVFIKHGINALFSSENMAQFVANGAVSLYYDNFKKFETTSTGIKTSGNIDVNGAYTLPTSDGTNGQILTTDGSGAVTFQDAIAAGETIVASSLGTNGYIKYSSGFIIQWGYRADYSGTMDITFPITFPTRVFCWQGIGVRNSQNYQAVTVNTDYATDRTTIRMYWDSNSNGVLWFAIGN